MGIWELGKKPAPRGGLAEVDVEAGEAAEAIEAALAAIAAGDYGRVPAGEGRLGRAVRSLAETLQAKARSDLEAAVQQSLRVIEQMIAATTMYCDVQHVGTRSETMAAAAEALAGTVSAISQSSDQAAGDAAESVQAASEGARLSADAVTQMQGIATAVAAAAGQVAHLSTASEQIGEIVAQIEAIAKQTNLLALNATIEAARAGEAGKGFAVVAGEVKGLANQTARATESIRGRIDGLRGEMNGIVASMQRSAEAVESGERIIGDLGRSIESMAGRAAATDGRMQDVARILERQRAASGEVSGGVQAVAADAASNLRQIEALLDAIDRAQGLMLDRVNALMSAEIPEKTLLVARLDHLLWRKRLAAMIVGRETLRADELADPHRCRFGRWYDSQQDGALAADPDFRALDAPHRALHALGVAAARRFAEGDRDGALAAVAETAEPSAEILRRLDALAHRRSRDAAPAAGPHEGRGS